MIGQVKLASIATVYAYDAVWLAIAPPPFSDTFWVMVGTAIPATILATGTLIVGIRNSRKSDKIIEKAVEIHTLTNSRLSSVMAELSEMRSQNKGLERLIASKDASAMATLRASEVAETATEARAAESAAVAAAAASSTPPHERS